MTNVTRVLVGLGNPGDLFDFTRHNIGFMVMDRMSALAGAPFQRVDHLHGDVCRYADALIVKPHIGMNDSGKCVRAVLDQYGLDLGSLLIAYDDVSLPQGKMRFRFAGSAGGHHGIESTIEELGKKTDFHKLKVGCGPDPLGAERKKYVLAKLDAATREHFNRIVEAAAEACIFWLANDSQKCASKFNSLMVA